MSQILFFEELTTNHYTIYYTVLSTSLSTPRVKYFFLNRIYGKDIDLSSFLWGKNWKINLPFGVM